MTSQYETHQKNMELNKRICEDLFHRISLSTEKDIRVLFKEGEEITYAMISYHEGNYLRARTLLGEYLRKSIARKKMGDICE